MDKCKVFNCTWFGGPESLSFELFPGENEKSIIIFKLLDYITYVKIFIYFCDFKNIDKNWNLFSLKYI